MRVSKTESIKNYRNLLNEVYDLCQNGGNFSITHVMIKHRVSHVVSQVLINHNIIAKQGRGRWIWTGARPTENMVSALLFRTSKLAKEKADRRKMRKENQVIEKPKEQKKVSRSQKISPEIHTFEKPEKSQETKVSILWGLFSYQKKT